MARPVPEDYAPFFENYIRKTVESQALPVLEDSVVAMEAAFASIGEDKADFAYADGKWTIRQMLQHMIDTERVFAYRAMRIARKDETPLPGFDENLFAQSAQVSHIPLKALMQEMIDLRKATVTMFRHFTAEDMQCAGTASGGRVTVNALAFIIVGHVRHHFEVLRERYGVL